MSIVNTAVNAGSGERHFHVWCSFGEISHPSGGRGHVGLVSHHGLFPP